DRGAVRAGVSPVVALLAALPDEQLSRQCGERLRQRRLVEHGRGAARDGIPGPGLAGGHRSGDMVAGPVRQHVRVIGPLTGRASRYQGGGWTEASSRRIAAGSCQRSSTSIAATCGRSAAGTRTRSLAVVTGIAPR